MEALSTNNDITFGVVTKVGSTATVALTLYWEGSVYQCNVEPNQNGLYYGCDTSNNETTAHCDSNTITPPIEYGLQVDIEHWDPVIIDAVIIQMMVKGASATYGGTYFCFNHSTTDAGNVASSDHCLSANAGGYDTIIVRYGDPFQSQIFGIDRNSSEEVYVHVNDAVDSHFSYVCTPIGACVNAILTPSYGSHQWLYKNVDAHQGRVYQISEWGVVNHTRWPTYPGIANLQWKSDKQTTFDDSYGWGDVVSCGTYTLRDDEYINGYTLIYIDDTTIRGITFHTNTQRIMPHCVSNYTEGTISTGKIIYPNRYLSGFHVGSGLTIDRLAFEFTAINYTCNNSTTPTVITTEAPSYDPTEAPSDHPTAPTLLPLQTTSTRWQSATTANNIVGNIGILVAVIVLCFCVLVLCFVGYKMRAQEQSNNNGPLPKQQTANFTPPGVGGTSISLPKYPSVMPDDGDDAVEPSVSLSMEGVPNVRLMQAKREDQSNATSNSIHYELKIWLVVNGFAHYLDNFVLHGYDSLEFVKDMQDVQDLVAIGITRKADQHKLMSLISFLCDDHHDSNTMHDEESVEMHVLKTSK